MLRNLLVLVIAFLVFTKAANAQQTPQKFVQELDYLLYLPDGYAQDTVKKWPLIIFLHGSGERGNDLEKVKMHGPPMLAAAGKKFPFIIASPQAKPDGGWEQSELYRFLQSLKKQYRVDPDRVYLTGLSMGGFGTWDLAMKHPEEFAAIAPICGGGDIETAWRLRNMKVWVFHGAKDNVVPPRSSEMMVDAVKKYNPSVRFTLYPEANHNSWTVTYNNDSLYQWFLDQKRFTYKSIVPDPAILASYAGRYADHFKDTVNLFIKDGKLQGTDQSNNSFELKAASNTIFFVNENMPLDVRFDRTDKGQVKGFTLMAEKMVLFNRIK